MEHTIVPIKANHSLAVCALYYTAKDSFKDILDFARALHFYQEQGAKYQKIFFDEAGWNVFSFMLDGKVYWKLRFKDYMFGVECTEYTSWVQFKDATRELTDRFITEYWHSIQRIGFYVNDIFRVLLDGMTTKEFSLEELFNNNSEYIVPAFFMAKHPPAYSYCDTTEHNDDFSRIFKFDNVAIGIKVSSSRDGLIFELENQLSSLLLDGIGAKELLGKYYDKIDYYHNKNKILLSNILTDKIQNRIGLHSHA